MLASGWSQVRGPDRDGLTLTPDAPDEYDTINSSAAYRFVFDIRAVEVDRATEQVGIDRYAASHDAGRMLNPALADGQIRGAFA